ncbi:phosphotransferase-like protein [Psychromonas aquimarina]
MRKISIVFNGTSSAGKSIIAKEIQKQSGTIFVYSGGENE